MASSSNPPDASAKQENAYLYASNTNVSNFVSVKLSGDRNYHLWKKQMICLMEAHDMRGLVLDDGPLMKNYDTLLVKKYDSLLKGWIFGSVTEDVLHIVVDDDSAKVVWRNLKAYFDSTMSSKQVSAPIEADTKSNTKDTNVVSGEITTNEKGTASTQSKAKDNEEIQIEIKDSSPTKVGQKIEIEAENAEAKTKYIDTDYPQSRRGVLERLREHIECGEWDSVYVSLKWRPDAITEVLNSDGNTALHIVVGVGRSDIIKTLSSHLRSNNLDLTKIKNSDGSTVLHIAVIVGDIKAAELLVKENERLLNIPDNKGQTALDIASRNMDLDMTGYLLEAAENNKKAAAHVDGRGETNKSSLLLPIEIGINLLANAISEKRYDLATKLIRRNPEYVVSNDVALMAMARTFPNGLSYGETLFYPRLDDNRRKMIIEGTKWPLVNMDPYIPQSVVDIFLDLYNRCTGYPSVRWTTAYGIYCICVALIIVVVGAVVYSIFVLLMMVLLMVYFTVRMLYFLSWKFAASVVPAMKNIEMKKKEYEEAKNVVELVCEVIMERCPDNSSHINLYTGPILEAACQDAYEVVDEILRRWPAAIRCQDKNGYDIIQLATIHRSERIYNLIYIMGERKRIYGTIVDSCKNNMLHLAARLAPSNKLKLRTGAALQLQRELQWRQEVRKLVIPIYVTKGNIFSETPDMVFTKEHENLVKEGEKWMKAVAESSSITAALITTIVFAAAITVPGGSNQETGVPMFLEKGVFTVFAIADAISLFSSATALLVFLSILTARFAEQDFLVRLPRLLIIGLCTLLLSTTAMMVAFSATLFLVFSRQKVWVLAPICGLALVPIGSFFVLQFPLILDLFRSTYTSKFDKRNHVISKLNPNNIRSIFGK